MEAREIIRDIEESVSLPAGRGERFAGYAVIGLPFRSGDVLAMRRFPASSISLLCPNGATTSSPTLPLRLRWVTRRRTISNRNAVASFAFVNARQAQPRCG